MSSAGKAPTAGEDLPVIVGMRLVNVVIDRAGIAPLCGTVPLVEHVGAAHKLGSDVEALLARPLPIEAEPLMRVLFWQQFRMSARDSASTTRCVVAR